MPYGPHSTWTLVHPSQPQPTQPQTTYQPQAPPPSYLVQQLHHSPPTDPATATPIQPPPAPQQTLPATTPTEPQWHMPQGVWQPYSAFPPVTQPLHHSPSQPQLALSDSPQDPQPQQQPAPLDPNNPVPNTATTATGSQPSPSPSIASPPPATVAPDPATGAPAKTVSPAQPSPHPPHSSRRHHHKSRRKTDHHRSGRHRHRRRRKHRHHSTATKHHSSSWRHRSPSTSTYSYSSTPSRSRSRQPIDLYDPTQTPPQQTIPTLTPRNIHLHQWSVDHPTDGDPHNTFRPYRQRSKSSLGLTFMLTSSTLPTDLNINTWPTSSSTATSHTKTSLISGNTPVKWNEATQQYDQFQYNAISLPYLNTKASRTSPPPVSRATSTHREVAHINAGHTGPVGNITNILRQGRFLPSTLHFPNYPGFFAQGVRITHNQQATPQEHPLPHRHTPGMGRRHEIHFWRRRAGYDPSTRPPRSRLSSERQMLGHPPRPCHRQRPGMVHQLHPTGPMTPPHTTSLQPPTPGCQA